MNLNRYRIEENYPSKIITVVIIKILAPQYDNEEIEKIKEYKKEFFNSILNEYGPSNYLFGSNCLSIFFSERDMILNSIGFSKYIIDNFEFFDDKKNYLRETFYVKIIIDLIKQNNYNNIKSSLFNKVSNQNRFDEIIISKDIFSRISSITFPKIKFRRMNDHWCFYKRKRKQFPNRSYKEMIEFFLEKKLKPLDDIISKEIEWIYPDKTKLKIIEIEIDSIDDFNKSSDKYLSPFKSIIPINKEKKIGGWQLLKKQIHQSIQFQGKKIKVLLLEKINSKNTLQRHVSEGNLEIEKIIGE